MVVCDMGCGSGIMTLYLAQKVGPKGHVYAVDASEAQLDIVRKKVADAGLTNVTCVRADVQDASQLGMDNVDFVYSRLILMHLPKARVALENMYRLLKPGGVMTLQEATWETIDTNYPSKLMYKFRDAVIKLGKHKGVDFNIGRKLSKMCQSLIEANIQSYDVKNPIPLWMFKALMRMRLKEMKFQLLEAELIDQALLSSWEQEYESMPDDDDQYFVNPATITCVIVRKES